MSGSLFPGADALPAQAGVLDAVRHEVDRDPRWRWLELGCSLAAGRGDQFSDVDAGVGYAGQLAAEDLEREGELLVRAAGPVSDLLVHAMTTWPATVRRFAVEYATGVQLDLVLMPAGDRPGLPAGSVALVDKDGQLSRRWQSAAAGPTERLAREWTMLGWWALSDVAKYLRRGSLFEAVERISEARQHALRLFAVARRVPYPSFGLTSLLDTDPPQLPEGLHRGYCRPDDPAAVAAAAHATAELLATASADAAALLGVDLATAWSDAARRRLAAASTL